MTSARLAIGLLDLARAVAVVEAFLVIVLGYDYVVEGRGVHPALVVLLLSVLGACLGVLTRLANSIEKDFDLKVQSPLHRPSL